MPEHVGSRGPDCMCRECQGRIWFGSGTTDDPYRPTGYVMPMEWLLGDGEAKYFDPNETAVQLDKADRLLKKYTCQCGSGGGMGCDEDCPGPSSDDEVRDALSIVIKELRALTDPRRILGQAAPVPQEER